MECHEFRCSRDIDFLVSKPRGYLDLRAVTRGKDGVHALFSDALEVPRPPRIDQYGIRFPVRVDGETMKIEIIAEGRVSLDRVTGSGGDVSWASIADCFCEKLLANSDRGFDSAFLSRDLVDLGALRFVKGPIPESAWVKSLGAYGVSVVRDLERLATSFLENEEHQGRCFERLDVRNPEEILEGIREILADPRLSHDNPD